MIPLNYTNFRPVIFRMTTLFTKSKDHDVQSSVRYM